MPALERALGQHLREPSSHRVSSDISPPAPSMLSAATNLIDRGDEVLGSLQQLSLRLGISGSMLPLLELWWQQQLDLGSIEKVSQHLTSQRGSSVAEELAS